MANFNETINAVELIKEAKRNIESCKNSLGTNVCQLEKAMNTIQVALMEFEDRQCALSDMLAKLDDMLRKLK